MCTFESSMSMSVGMQAASASQPTLAELLDVVQKAGERAQGASDKVKAASANARHALDRMILYTGLQEGDPDHSLRAHSEQASDLADETLQKVRNESVAAYNEFTAALGAYSRLVELKLAQRAARKYANSGSAPA